MIEPIAGLVSDIDTSVDSRVDDFASVDDPKWTGWHKLEAVALGAGELIEEVSDGKINGEEDRYSHTDLADFDANQLGAKQAYGSFRTIIMAKDKALATAIDNGFTEVEESLRPYEIGEGVFKPFTDLKPADKTAMQAGSRRWPRTWPRSRPRSG